jgi:hypothetical protein
LTLLCLKTKQSTKSDTASLDSYCLLTGHIDAARRRHLFQRTFKPKESRHATAFVLLHTLWKFLVIDFFIHPHISQRLNDSYFLSFMDKPLQLLARLFSAINADGMPAATIPSFSKMLCRSRRGKGVRTFDIRANNTG